MLMDTLVKTVNSYISNSDTSISEIGMLILLALVFVLIALDLMDDIRLHNKK